MKDFKSFYETTLLSSLTKLEQERKQLARIAILYLLMAAGLLIISHFVNWFTLIAWIVIAILAYLFWKNHYHKMGALNIRYKEEVIRKLVKFIEQSLEYSPTKGLPSNEYHRSRFFDRLVDRYRSEDLVSGTLGKTSIQFAEVHTEWKQEFKDKDNIEIKLTFWRTIFRGMYFVIDFNKKFEGRTMVLPYTGTKWFNSSEHGELIKLENPDFNKVFTVYGTDQIEARYILSTSLMQRILDLRNKTGNIYLCFADSLVYIALPLSRNLFEAHLFISFLDYKRISNFYSYLLLSTGIVEDLNLNTRIWTKE